MSNLTSITNPTPVNRARILDWLSTFRNSPELPDFYRQRPFPVGDGLTVRVHPCEKRVCVEFKGTLADMLAAGAIDPTMFESLRTPLRSTGNQYSRRHDEHGNGYRIVRKKAGVPEGTVTRYITDRARALELPGVLGALAEMYAQFGSTFEPVKVRNHLRLVWVNPTI